jgi:hypothetical protein
VEQKKVEDLSPDSQLRALVADLLKRTLSQLSIWLPDGSIIAALRDLRKYEVFIVRIMQFELWIRNCPTCSIFNNNLC